MDDPRDPPDAEFERRRPTGHPTVQDCLNPKGQHERCHARQGQGREIGLEIGLEIRLEMRLG